MSRRTGRNNNYTSGMAPSGFFRAEVVAVSGEYVSVKVSRLGLNNIYEDVPFTGFSPAVGDRVWVSFVEGRASHLLAFVGAGDTSTDITEIVAGTNLNGGGSGGSITVNLDDDITLSTVTADGFYGDLYGDVYGAIHIPVKNVSGGSLTKGTPVYATGAVGASGAVEVEASLAGTSSTMPAMGLLDQDLANNGQGDVVVSGVLQHIDTDTPGYSVGDELYVAASGGLTTTRPTGSSQLVQKIGKVIRVQQNTGEILVQGAGRTNDVPNSFSTSGDVTVGGDLTVNGTTVTLNTETLTVEDNIIVLNSNVTGTPSLDAGIEVERGSETNVSFLWDESADAWSIGAVDFLVDTNTLFVDASTDRVGIGTTAPESILHLSPGTNQTPDANGVGHLTIDGSGYTSFLTMDGTGTWVGNNSNSRSVILATDETARLTVTGTGNVGIGTSTPQAPVHVYHATDDRPVRIESGDAGAYIGFVDNTTTGDWYRQRIGVSGNDLRFVTNNNTSRMVILSNGNVGINDDTPDYRLDVNGTGRFTGNLTTGGKLYFSNTALIASEASSTNIDHIWHDDGSNAWHFCSDTTYRGAGNSSIVAGSFSGSGSGLTSVNAATLGGLGLKSSSGTPSGSQVIRSHTNGYTYLGWINTTSGATTSTISRIYASNDAFVRYVTPATFRSQIINGEDISPSSVTATGVVTANEFRASDAGPANDASFTFSGDEDTGLYRYSTNQPALSAGGVICLIAASGTVNTAGLASTTTSGYRYVLRNSTYGTLYHYTSSAELKENITSVTATDAGAWIDALQPVTFVERWLQEGEEPEDARAFRESDIQVGFIAEDVYANADSAQFAQVEDNDGVMKPVGWKWECVIAAAVAEIKSLRARIDALEAGS